MKKSFLLALAVISIFLAADTARAAGLVPCGGPGEKVCDMCFLFSMAKNAVEFALTVILTPLAALIFIVGGFNLMANRGNPESIAKTKKMLFATTIGLLIIFGGWVVVNTSLAAMGFEAWQGSEGNWWKFNVACDSAAVKSTDDIEVCPGS